MKTYIHLISFVFLNLIEVNTVNAISSNLFDDLLKVNQQWQFQDDINRSNLMHVKGNFTAKEIISIHLSLVEDILRSRNVTHLNESQKENRVDRLNDLNMYWNAARYPKNIDFAHTIPYFIDAENTACAVGELLIKSGCAQVANSIANTQNNAYLFNIKHKDLSTWTELNGFTLNELAWIQPIYEPNCIENAQIDVKAIAQNETCDKKNGSITIESVTSSNTEIIYVDWLDSDAYSRENLSAGIYTFIVHYHNWGAFTTCDVPYEFVIENEDSEICYKPVAKDDFILAQENYININVLANDSDPNDDALTLKIHSVPTCGKLTLNENASSFDYIFGNEKKCSFSYEICDNTNYCAVANVVVERESDESDEISAYPIPAESYITFVSNNYVIEKTEIYSLSGSKKKTVLSNSVNLNNIEAGNYIAKLYFNTGEVASKAFMIK